jgi:hypothetical protein
MDAVLFGREGLFSKNQTVRRIGVGCTNIDESEYVQMDLFSWAKTMKADEERKREEEARLEAEKAERQRLEEARRAADIEAQQKKIEQLADEQKKEKLLEREKKQATKKQRLDEMLAKVRKKYGDNAIHKGSES